MMWVIGFINTIERVDKDRDDYMVDLRDRDYVGRVTIYNEPQEITSNLLIRKTGISGAPLENAKFEIDIQHLSQSCLYKVSCLNTTLGGPGNGEGIDESKVLSWQWYPEDQNMFGLKAIVYSQASDIVFSGLSWGDQNKPIHVSARETSAPSGTATYYYSPCRDGGAYDFDLYYSWLSNNNQTYLLNKEFDRYGNSAEAYWFPAANCWVMDFHNEPIYRTNLLLRKYSMNSVDSRTGLVTRKTDRTPDAVLLPGTKFNVTISGLATNQIKLYDYDPNTGNRREVWSNRYSYSQDSYTGSWTLTAWDLLSGSKDIDNQIWIENLDWCYNSGNKIHITVDEISVPKRKINGGELYHKAIGKMEFDIYPSMVADGKDTTINSGTIMNNTTKDQTNAYYSAANKLTVINVWNRPLMKLSGNVWLDGQTGVKNVAGPNGWRDSSESKIQGVTVNLYKNNNTVFKTTSSKSDGTYSFEDIPYDSNGYRIGFGYDGISYIETISNLVSNGNVMAKEKIGTGNYSDATEYQISMGADKYGKTFEDWNNSLRDRYNAGRKSVVLGSCYSVRPCGASDHSSISGTGFSTKFRYKNSTKTGEKQVSSLKYDINVNGKNSDSRCNK